MLSMNDAMLLLALILLLLFELCFIVFADPYIRRDHRRVILIIIALCFSLIIQNILEYSLSAGNGTQTQRTLASIYGYSVRPVLLILFLYIVQPKGKPWLRWGLCGLNAAVYSTALFSHLCFWFDADNQYNGGPLANTCFAVCAFLLADLLYQTIRSYRAYGWRRMWIPVFNTLIILLSAVMDYHVYDSQRITFLTAAIVASCLFYYIWLHLQFSQEHEQELVAGQRVQIMLSQIKPHFIYNALACIEDLCDSSPQTAKAATITFSRYLRGNMNSLSQEGMIPFEKELEHTKLYLDLEQIRFEDALHVRYRISCVDFRMPTLTLEPIVENAVRHGVRGNENGRGTVVISTAEYPDAYGVIVEDDGPGFCLSDAPVPEAEHLGLRNVCQRLQSVCGGSLRIKTAPGEGTSVTILLPKNGENAPC